MSHIGLAYYGNDKKQECVKFYFYLIQIKMIVTNPLTYCMPNKIEGTFRYGVDTSRYGVDSQPCQAYMASKCADKWDGNCEYASNFYHKFLPNLIDIFPTQMKSLTSGQIMIRNAAMRKYLIDMNNCDMIWQPFDPNDPSSEYIWWYDIPPNGPTSIDRGKCVPIFNLSNDQLVMIDRDPVMNRLIIEPNIAPEVLHGIYKTMSSNNELSLLKNTKLGRYYGL